MSEVSSRVTFSQLPQFVGKTVRVVGNVKAIEGNALTLSDEQGARAAGQRVRARALHPNRARAHAPSARRARSAGRCAGAEVRIACKGVPRFREGVVEAIGTVASSGAECYVDEMTSTQFQPGFNLELYREAVTQLHRFPQLYPVS